MSSSVTRRGFVMSAAAASALRGQAAPVAPKPLSPGAVTHDWKSFLGPTHNAVSTETKLNRKLPVPVLWEFKKGTGYTSPAIEGTNLYYIHRRGGAEIVECLNAITGAPQWQFQYPTVFEDRYGYNNGPRASPVIDDGRVFTMGAETKLHCLDAKNGKVIWKKDLRSEYGVKQDFFGTASTPLIEGNMLIVNVGAPNGPCVAAFNKTNGKEIWRAGKEWGASYASPIPAVVHGKRRVFVFAGGESSPPTGGLLCIDPANGKIDFSFPLRSRTVESVNASCPVIFDNKVFVSASYRTGGALLEILPDFTHKVLWRTDEFALHFNTPIYKDGHLYGFDGRNEPDASLKCINVETGKVVWKEEPTWVETMTFDGQTDRATISTYRGSLMHVDGAFLCLGEIGHLLWMDLSPAGYKEISRTWLFAAKESWSLPVLSKGLLYASHNTRDIVKGLEPR
jgi:outer membrane protein assembly factor BamB